MNENIRGDPKWRPQNIFIGGVPAHGVWAGITSRLRHVHILSFRHPAFQSHGQKIRQCVHRGLRSCSIRDEQPVFDTNGFRDGKWIIASREA
jgi:hypothetical protein